MSDLGENPTLREAMRQAVIDWNTNLDYQRDDVELPDVLARHVNAWLAARELVVPSPQPDALDAKIVQDLAALDPLIPAGAGSVLDEVYCALCLAEGPASRPGDDFEHEASCPWLRAVIMQIEAAAVSPLTDAPKET